jgi:hypothetical protein
LASTISIWFWERYKYAGTFKLPNLVPINKWMMRNAYHTIMDLFPNHSMWNVLDKKDSINGNTLPKKVCTNPLTGYVNVIPVTGDFCKAHNMFAVVSGNPNKKSSIAYY